MLVLEPKTLSECGISTTSGFYTQTYPMNAIPEGDDQGARTGRKVRLLSGTMKGMLFQETSTSGAVYVKIYVFIWKKYQTSDWGTNPYVNSPSYGLFLEEDPISGFPAYNSFRNNDFKKDYAVLKTVNLVLPADNYSGQARRKPFSFSYKIPQKYALNEYKGISNQDLTNPAIHCIAVSNNGLTSNNTGVDIVFQNRIYFTDL